MTKTALLLLIITAEFLLESYFARKYDKHKWFKVHHFSLLKYLIFFGIPFATILLYSWQYQKNIIYAFLTFAVIGTFLEWIIGYAYNAVEGKRLWTYHSFNINKYTSWLSIPLWGLAGMLFWILINSL